MTLTLAEQLPVVGGAVWVEQRLFELEGRWSDAAADPEVAAHLATNSRHHGWHAELLGGCLPDSPALEADGHVVAPGPGWTALLEGDPADAVEWPDAGWAHLVALTRVMVPRNVVSYDRLTQRLSPVADGPLLRSLGHVLADQVAEWRAGEQLVQARLATPGDVTAAANLVAALEGLLATAD